MYKIERQLIFLLVWMKYVVTVINSVIVNIKCPTTIFCIYIYIYIYIYIERERERERESAFSKWYPIAFASFISVLLFYVKFWFCFDWSIHFSALYFPQFCVWYCGWMFSVCKQFLVRGQFICELVHCKFENSLNDPVQFLEFVF